MNVSDLMPSEEYDALSAEHGVTYAAYELAARWLRAWRDRYPDEDRDDLELILSGDFPDALYDAN